jgi:hypothetical protein
MIMMKPLFDLLLISVALVVVACDEAAPDPLSCDTACEPGEVCDPNTGRCMPQSQSTPTLEVLPPVGNTQGWVAQEFPKPVHDAAGKVNLQLRPAVSVQGGVYASHDLNTIVPAQIIAWRDSEIEGRPKVQVEGMTGAGKRDTQKETYVMWLSSGHSFTFFINPLPPYDTKFPPLYVPPIKVNDHLKKNFILDGDDRAVVVKGKVVNKNGETLVADNLFNEKGVKLAPSVRVRAFESDGERRSTIGITDSSTGAFSIKVPTGVSTYNIRVESAGVLPNLNQAAGQDATEGMPIPTLECKGIVLGLAPSQHPGEPPTQDINEIRLPSFRIPQILHMMVRGRDGTPVKGAAVTFRTEVKALAPNKHFEQCSATYSRTSYSDASGKVSLLLLPGSSTASQVYEVTVISPPTSAYASQWFETPVGPAGGTREDIVLEPRYRLSGTVTRRDTGALVTGVTIEARGVASGSSTEKIPATTATATTDKDGAYELHVDPGIYNLELSPPQSSGLPSLGITAKRIDADVVGKEFVIPSPKVLLGTVLDPSGKPLSSAQVQMFELVPKTEKPLTQSATLRASSVTNADGLFGLLLANGQ